MGHTLGTAAKATGLSRTAILRAIKSGKISASKNVHGEWDIDPAELHRVYPRKQDDAVTDNSNMDNAEFREIKAKLEAAERLIAVKDGVIDQLTRRLDNADEERRTTLRQLTALLTNQRPANDATPPTKRRWRLWGRG